jgi:AcrR family transcriptional regulator
VYDIHLSIGADTIDDNSPGSKTDPSTRARLNRPRVVAEAVAIADREGIDALSMQRLADHLGVVPMAIYKHVANKGELLAAMVDHVLGEATDPDDDDDWEADLRNRALSMRDVLLRHPWAIGLMESSTPGPENLRHHNATMGCLRDKAGLSVPMAVHAYGLLNAFIYGFSYQEKTLMADHSVEGGDGYSLVDRETLDDSAHPYLREAHAEVSKKGYDFNDEFAFAIDVILEAIDRLRQRPEAPT